MIAGGVEEGEDQNLIRETDGEEVWRWLGWVGNEKES
jgi:hypothetical protein